MDLDDNTTKIILGVIALLTIIVSGALVSVKKIRKRSSKSTISNTNISGNNSKIVAGDDNSQNK